MSGCSVNEKSVKLDQTVQANENTEYMAKLIQAEIGGDIHFIETKEKYSSDYDGTDNNKLDVQTNIEHRDDVRSELAGEVIDMEDYDVIFLGFGAVIIGLN